MKKCYFCGHESTNSLFCLQCGKILPVCWDNYFLLFDLPLVFDLDKKILDERYYKVLSLVHTDNVHKLSEDELHLFQAASSFVNSAYKVLQKPWSRAEYLLKVNKDLDCSSDEVEQDWLMEVMLLREEMEDAQNHQKSRMIALEKERSMLGELVGAFQSDDVKKAAKIIAKHRFIKRILEDINSI